MAGKQKSFMSIVVSKQRRQLKVINSNHSFNNNHVKVTMITIVIKIKVTWK